MAVIRSEELCREPRMVEKGEMEMAELMERLKWAAWLGESLAKVINLDTSFLAIRTDTEEDESQTFVLHLYGNVYEELKREINPEWKLVAVTDETYHFEARYEGIKLLMLFDENELPEELRSQVEKEKALPAGTDKAEA